MSYPVGDLAASIQMMGLPGFLQDVRTAQSAFDNVGNSGSRAFSTIRQGITLAAGVTSALTIAGTAYITSLFKTGEAYNDLQQKSKAALTVMLGGTKQASEQLAQLNAFASNSPFAKQVFLQAQQQLLGFGMAAKNVIPTLQSVQDAVAAMGGSGDDISQIVDSLAKVQSEGKITARTLEELGTHGIDAAALIGSQMGKTGAQIRDDITNGALDAQSALSDLVTGMEQKYAGAAAGLKQTWDGMQDRVKAASRDIGSELAAPFIDPNGGGMAVDWGNQVADVLRAIQKQAQPVITTIEGRLTPAFAAFTGFLDQALVDVKSWDSTKFEHFLNTAGQYAPEIAAVAGATFGLTGEMLKQVPVIGQYLAAVNPVVAALIGLAAASPPVRAALTDLLKSLSPLVPVGKQLAAVIATSLNSALPVAAGLIRVTAEAATPLVKLLAAVPAPVLASALAFLALNRAVSPALGLIASLADKFLLLQTGVGVTYLDAVEGGATRVGAAMKVAGAGATFLGNSLKAALIDNAPTLVILGVVGAVASLVNGFEEEQARVAEVNAQIRQYRDTLSSLGEITDKTADAVRSNLVDALKKQYDWTTALGTLVSKSGGVDQALMKFGLTTDGIADSITNGGPAYESMISHLKVLSQQTEYQNVMGEGNIQVSTDQAIAAQSLRNEITKQHAEVEATTEAEKARNDTLRDSQAKMSDAAKSYERFSDALKILHDTTKSTDEQLQALETALDELKGGSQSAAQQQADLAQKVLDVKSALADSNHSWINAAGSIDLGTQSGVSFAQQLGTMSDAMDQAEQSAYNYAWTNSHDVASAQAAAQSAGESYIGTLKDTFKQAGLTDDQINGLIGTYFNVPAVVSTTLTLPNVTQTQKQILGIIDTIYAVPGQKTVTIDDPNSPDVIQRLQDMGYTVTNLPNGKITIALNGLDTAAAALQAFQRHYETITVNVNTVLNPNSAVRVPYATAKATGGPIIGPGTGTSDTAGLFALSNGEHVITAQEVQAAGGHDAIMAIRQAILNGGVRGRADGGPVHGITMPPTSVSNRYLSVTLPNTSTAATLSSTAPTEEHNHWHLTPAPGESVLSQANRASNIMRLRRRRKG